MCYDKSLLPSLAVLLYHVNRQYARMKWYCVLGDWTWLSKSLLPKLSLCHPKYSIEMVSCLGDLLRKSLLLGLICCCVMSTCNIYI